MREKIMRWMTGRNGVDELAQAELWVVMAGLILSIFIKILYIPTLVLMVHTYFRVFSRNTSKRYAENQKWRNMRYKMAIRRSNWKKRWNERGIYKYFKCPQCRQKVRVPAGHGRICITCPKCRAEFVKRS